MPLVIPDGYGQVTFLITHPLDPDPWNITWGMSLGAETDMQEYVGNISQATRDTLKETMDPNYTLGPCSLRADPSGSAEGIWLDTSTTVGIGTASDNLPQNCANLVHKRTNLAGRRGRGRIYLPGVESEEVDEAGRLSAGYRTGLQEDVDAWLDALTSISPDLFGMYLLHSTGISATPDPTEVTALQVDAVIATQRRRLRR